MTTVRLIVNNTFGNKSKFHYSPQGLRVYRIFNA